MLTGVLRPDLESRFRPAQVTNSATNTDALSALMLKPPKTTWPLDNDPGAKRALKYLGNTNPQLGPDPRSADWTQSCDRSDTESIRGDIAKVPYPAGEDFTSAQFRCRESAAGSRAQVGGQRPLLADDETRVALRSKRRADSMDGRTDDRRRHLRIGQQAGQVSRTASWELQAGSRQDVSTRFAGISMELAGLEPATSWVRSRRSSS
jgi:hypothetical protein